MTERKAWWNIDICGRISNFLCSMATAEVEVPKEAAVPDYLASPNAVFDDKDVQWRYGHAPDYSKTRAVWENSKSTRPCCVCPTDMLQPSQ